VYIDNGQISTSLNADTSTSQNLKNDVLVFTDIFSKTPNRPSRGLGGDALGGLSHMPYGGHNNIELERHRDYLTGIIIPVGLSL
jgi:hypothetical protein